MEKTADQLTDEEMDIYREGAKKRLRLKRKQIAERRQVAGKVAREAANLLRERYHVTRVVKFGSILNDQIFTEHSDIDPAAWGLLPHQSLAAMGDLWDLDLSRGIPIQLVDVSSCNQDLLLAIHREGVDV